MSSPVRVVLATSNPHKLDEIAGILGDGFEVLPHATDVAETGDTYEANALLKARDACASTGALAIADDSGIEVEAMAGEPGIHSARWTTEDRWLTTMLDALASTTGIQRAARYVCAAVAVWPDGREEVAFGEVAGLIAERPRGENGFGYDPIFVPHEGDGRTFGEMDDAEKREISHRGRAFRALAELLR
jgi:XTP/dITP diphosphohydrolase